MICVLHSHANRGAHADNQIRRSAGWQRKAYRPHVPDSSMGVPSAAAAAAPAALAPSTMLPPPSVSIGCARWGIEHAESVNNRRCRESTIGEERCIEYMYPGNTARSLKQSITPSDSESYLCCWWWYHWTHFKRHWRSWWTTVSSWLLLFAEEKRGAAAKDTHQDECPTTDNGHSPHDPECRTPVSQRQHHAYRHWEMLVCSQ